MSQENVEIVRQSYEIAKSIGGTGADLSIPKRVAPAFWARLDPDADLDAQRERAGQAARGAGAR